MVKKELKEKRENVIREYDWTKLGETSIECVRRGGLL